jgi:hypothetical protein
LARSEIITKGVEKRSKIPQLGFGVVLVLNLDKSTFVNCPI